MGNTNNRIIAAASISVVIACHPKIALPPESPVSGRMPTIPTTAPLGAHYDAVTDEITFRVASLAATRIELWLYADPIDADPAGSVQMSHVPATGLWSATIREADLEALYGITGTLYYGYRAWGPNWPYSSQWQPGTGAGFFNDVDGQGNRFNPNKLLNDPYGLELSHDPLNPAYTDGTIYASGPHYRELDSGRWAPKSILVLPDSDSTGVKPTRALKDDVVYEVHLRGLTKNDPSIPAAYRGTYRGAALKAVALAELGVTAIEFLPLHETQNDTNDVDPTSAAGDNYWGYMSLSYFAPDRRYAYDQSPGGPTRELKAMVRAFHDAGIKVFVDVVYNHTGEGGAWSASDPSTFSLHSWRGLDNPTYYCLTADRQLPWDNTGVGGNFNTYNPIAQRQIIDSLHYWSDTLGVDGFRFDLASVLGNTCEHGCFQYDKLDPGTALNGIARALGPRPMSGGDGVDLIGEPWAFGGNTYQVGEFPSGWAEWNDAYRDSLRKDQNQLGVEAVTPGELATRIAGSSDLFGDDGRQPGHSVNFVVAHDGLTHRDLYGCNGKNNGQPWPLGPSDGGNDANYSWDQAGIATDQRKAARNGMALLLLSAGTPMLTGGDELLRSLQCNNNPYNVDSVANWLSYNPTAEQQIFRTFTQRMIAFRAAHPALRPLDFYSPHDENSNVMEQHRWFTPAGQVPDAAYFNDPDNHAIAFRLDGTELGDPAGAIYVAYNGWSSDVDFHLPWPGNGRRWHRVTDTCPWAEGPSQVAVPGHEEFIGDEWTLYRLCGRGVLVAIAR
jgi:glycogen operon protein